MNHHQAFHDLFKHAPSNEAVEDSFASYQQASKTLAERRQRLADLLQQRSQAEHEVGRATGSDRTEVVTKLMLAQTELTAMPAAIAEAAHAEVLAHAQQAAEAAFGVAVAGLHHLTDVTGAGAWTFATSWLYWTQAAERVSTAARVAASRQIAGASLIGDALRPLTINGTPA